MPIPTSSDAWNSADESEPLRDNILDFLQEHPNQAFYARELADEIIGTQWAIGEEKERLIQRVGEDEYRKNREEYEEQLGIDDREPVIPDLVETSRLRIRIGDLIRDGLVEGREIPTQHTKVPYDWETVTCFTYAEATGQTQ